MSRITVYGNKKDRKAVLEYLQRCKKTDISEPDISISGSRFSNMNTSSERSEFVYEKAIGEKALEILDRYAPENKGMLASLKGRKTLSVKEYYAFTDDIPEMLRISKWIIELSEGIAERKGNMTKCISAIDELEPWNRLDVSLDFEGTETTVCIVGTFGGELISEVILERYNADNVPPIHIEVVSSDPQQTYVFVLCSKKDAAACEKQLRAIGFSRPKSEYNGIPSENIEKYRKRISEFEREISELEKEIKSYEGTRSALKFLIDYYEMRTEKYAVLEKLTQSEHIFILRGYVPLNEAEELKSELEHCYGVAAELEEADEDAPILLKNAYLTEPVEGVVETFALPAHSEIDPTSIMALFYYVFFGLMLSDAAYGLIMVIGCGVTLLKFKDMEREMRKTLRLFMYCGISTVFWGIMFGSYFGDVVPVVSSTFFGKEATIPPLWFEPVKNPMRMLMFSFLLGLIHLFTGLGINLYQCIKRRDYMSAFVDCICWYLLIGGGVIYLFHVDMFLGMAGMTEKLPDVWAKVAAITAGIGALGILLFYSRRGGVGKRLAKGAYALYGATGWLSDILSYSRLLALGLATGVIATVFNKMGSMFGSGIVGAILFSIVFFVGHLLNIGVNLLGAYVHTNRLQFVEFFGKFYDGGGRAFKPFSGTTKYYKFKESNLKE